MRGALLLLTLSIVAFLTVFLAQLLPENKNDMLTSAAPPVPYNKPDMEAYLVGLPPCPDEKGKDQVITKTTTLLISLKSSTCWTHNITNGCGTPTPISSVTYPRQPYGIWIGAIPPNPPKLSGILMGRARQEGPRWKVFAL